MPGRFDASTKYLVENYPADWLDFLGLGPPEPVTVIDADLSTVSAEADKVLSVDSERPWILHLEFQTSYDPTMGQRLLRYNAMLHVEHHRPVSSILVLLRRSAGGPSTTGRYRVAV